jgi:hypothetical protein
LLRISADPHEHAMCAVFATVTGVLQVKHFGSRLEQTVCGGLGQKCDWNR